MTMKKITGEIYQVIKFNIKNILLFELLFRLITGPIYLQLINMGLKISLRAAGYSYLMLGNLVHFMIKPVTILIILVLLIVGIVLIYLESGSLITAYEAAVYYRKLTPAEMFTGGLFKTLDEIKKREAGLIPVLMANYLLIHLLPLSRALYHVKELRFLASSAIENQIFRLGLTIFLVIFILATLSEPFTCFASFVEQKSYRDSKARNRGLLRGHGCRAAIRLVIYMIFTCVIAILVYLFCITVTSLFAIFFVDPKLEFAFVIETGNKIESVILVLTSMMLMIVSYGALTVHYCQYSNRANRQERWNFSYSKQGILTRKNGIGLLCIAALISLLCVCEEIRNGGTWMNDTAVETLITAHRGSSSSAPENTMAAIEKAVEELADFAEIDVQESKDGEVILFHDNTLKRLLKIDKKVSSMTFHELEELDAGSWFSAKYQGEKIPALSEALEYARGRIHLNVEIKNAGRQSQLPMKVLNLIEEYDMQEQCVITSVNINYLRMIKELNPEIKTGYILSAGYGNLYEMPEIDFISIQSSFVNQSMVEMAHDAGKTVHAWTINRKSEMERLKGLNVDDIITDYPVLAREILYRENATEGLLEYLRMLIR